MDLIHLEAIGVIDSRLPLNHRNIRAVSDTTAGEKNVDNLWLAGHQYAIRLRALTTGNGTTLSFIALTEIGKGLVKALRRPPSLSYLCGLQRHFREGQVSAEIWSITRQGLEGDYFHAVSEITDGCKSIDVATQENRDNPG